MRVEARRPISVRPILMIIAALAAAFALIAVVALQAPGVAADSTVWVNVELQAHDNSILNIPANGTASYYAGGWHTITDVNPNNPSMVRVQLSPGNYTFALTYNGTRDTKVVTVGESATTVYFHAALVNVMIQAHDNSILDIPANGSASYYAAGWHGITGINTNNHSIVQTEMLPGTYTFAATYNGTRDTKTYTVIEPNPNNNANANQTVYFHAALINIELQSHTNGILDIPNNGSASYYANGWHAITGVNTNNPSMVQAEMLPGTYTFAATYNGTRDTKVYTVIEPNPNNNANAIQSVYFHAALVVVQLQAHDSSFLDIPANGAASYYASGWHAITDVNANNHRMVTAEMLPGTYTFALTYNGTRDTQVKTIIEPNPNNNANATQSVWFHTVQVISDSNTATSYYASGWQPFASGDELLPGTYTFNFSDATANTPETLVWSSGNAIVHIH